MSRSAGRTKRCDEAQARTRLDDARSRLDAAQNIADDDSSSADIRTAISNAIESGIASSDAACCRVLGQVSAGQDHHEALGLVRQIVPGGTDAARHLKRLLDVKTGVQYGFITGTPARFRASIRAASALLEFAEATLER